jgi:protein-disulfide isomerase
MREDGVQSGFNATPSLFVNGQQIAYQGWDSLQRAIAIALQAP